MLAGKGQRVSIEVEPYRSEGTGAKCFIVVIGAR
jgi:hypothetical protein